MTRTDSAGTLAAMGAVAGALGVALAVVSYWYEPRLALVVPLALAASPAAGRALEKWQALWRRLRWWHGLWLVALASALVFRLRDARAITESPVDGWAAYRIGLVGWLALVLVARLMRGSTSWLESMGKGIVGLLATYAMVQVASIAWSVYPAWTGYKSFEYLLDMGMLAAVVREAGSEEEIKSLLDWTWVLFAGLVGSVWVGVALWPAEAVVPGTGLVGLQIRGVLPAISANDVGEYSALVALVALARLGRRGTPGRDQWMYGVALVAGLGTMIVAQTRSAVLGFGLGLVVLLVASRKWAAATCLALLVAVAALLGGIDIAKIYLERGQSAKLNQNLTGRVDWWDAALRKWQERPLVGHGAYAGGRFAALADMGETKTSHLHNTYVEVLVGTGPLGVGLVVAAVAAMWRALARGLRAAALGSWERQLRVEALAVAALLTFRSFFSSHLVWHPSLSFLAVVAYAEYLRRRGATA